jgi:hypothetical protein
LSTGPCVGCAAPGAIKTRECGQNAHSRVLMMDAGTTQVLIM